MSDVLPPAPPILVRSDPAPDAVNSSSQHLRISMLDAADLFFRDLPDARDRFDVARRHLRVCWNSHPHSPLLPGDAVARMAAVIESSRAKPLRSLPPDWQATFLASAEFKELPARLDQQRKEKALAAKRMREEDERNRDLRNQEEYCDFVSKVRRLVPEASRLFHTRFAKNDEEAGPFLERFLTLEDIAPLRPRSPVYQPDSPSYEPASPSYSVPHYDSDVGK